MGGGDTTLWVPPEVGGDITTGARGGGVTTPRDSRDGGGGTLGRGDSTHGG